MTVARAHEQTFAPVSRGGTGTETFADKLLVDAFAQMPGAIELAVSDSPSGTLVYLIVDSSRREDDAYARFVDARRRIGDFALNLVCIPSDSTGELYLSEAARIYQLT